MIAAEVATCIKTIEDASSNRNFQLHNWLENLSLAEMVPVRDSFSYNKEIALHEKPHFPSPGLS